MYLGVIERGMREGTQMCSASPAVGVILGQKEIGSFSNLFGL